ncbi:MAG: DNA replication and repair protein RecF [Gemmatimonadota bacterium]|nr:DNA replication and repair protein RecF [Gemmatimonadota bacterium]
MRLTRLAIRHFRNLRNQDLEMPSEGIALIGDNAQGKTNFLEAIYYLETLRSFRGASDPQLITFGEDVFRVVGTTKREDDVDGPIELAAAFQRRGKRKKVTVDGSEVERLADALGALSAVIFSPADIELVSGGPSERRRFLNIVLSLNHPGYVAAIQEYRQVLQRRNASLKSGESASTVAAWQPALVRSGARVMTARRDWIDGKAEAFGDYYHRVSARSKGVMTYSPDVSFPEGADTDEIECAFRESLRDSADTERRRGVTMVGPHRDDVRLRLENEDARLDLRDFGSGGQRRTAAFALRLVEAATIRERRTRAPLMLLDDVFAELDPGRSERILELMESEDLGQVVLTAPKEADVRLRRDSLPRWRIQAGEIST